MYSPLPPPGVYTKIFKTNGLAEGYTEAICVENRGWGRLWGRLEGVFVKSYEVPHQVNVPGHQDVTGDGKTVAHPHGLKRLLKERLRVQRMEERLAAIAAPGKNGKAAGLVVTNESVRPIGQEQ